MDLPDLTTLSGTEPTIEQINAILAQIDLDIANLLRDGKLAALKYSTPGNTGPTADRGANLQALLEARKHYQQLLENRPNWQTTQYQEPDTPPPIAD